MGQNAHCESYINLQSKFTPATIAVCNAKPKAGAHAFGLALQTAIVAGVNFDRELMYDSQWAFFPHFNNAHHCDTVIGHHTITIC